MDYFVAAAIGYLIGSIPFAFLLTVGRGVDLRMTGSGNVGTANVLRTAGLPAAALTLLLDAAKGAVAVLATRRVADGEGPVVFAGVVSILGHVYPMWLRFKGGRGVATAAGVFAVLAPTALAISAAAFLAAAAFTGYVSVGSMVAALALATSTIALKLPGATITGAAVAAALVLHRHKANIARLVSGTEDRVRLRR
jgi:glycerol-3-phosphate acyltransferase PlsY